MAKKVEDEKVEITNVAETKTNIPQEDIIVGVNPFKTVYSRMSADNHNGEKLEVVPTHDNKALLIKSTVITNGKVSVSIATNGIVVGATVLSDELVKIV